MAGLFIFALVLGGALILVSLAGDIFGGAESIDTDADAGADAHGLKILSIRTLTYFLFTFGGVGAALHWGWEGERPLLTILFALVAGLFVGGLTAVLFNYLRGTQVGETAEESSFVGLTGRVIIPLSPTRPGKVTVLRGDRWFELTARPFQAEAVSPQDWREVIVVEMTQGIAFVAPAEGLAGEPLTPLPSP